MSNAPAPLRFTCELVDATGQPIEIRASFQDETVAQAFVSRNPPPPGSVCWRLRDRETGQAGDFDGPQNQ